MSNPLAESALEIWLIQDAITTTFRFRDFYNCTRVSKAWNRIFNPSLWKVIEPPDNHRLSQDGFLLDPDSTLHQPKFYRLVQELTIMRSGFIPLFHPLPPSPSTSSPLHHKNTTGEAIQQQGDRPWVDSPEPAFPALQVLQWFPTQNKFTEDPPQARVFNMLQFLQVHQNSLHSLYLQIWHLDEAIFSRLCSVLEAMPSLRRVALMGTWIHTSEQAQRFIWACRHLQSSYLPQGDHSVGRVNSCRGYRGGGLNMNAAVQIFSYYMNKPETLFPEEEPVWTPKYGPTLIRSLNLSYGVDRKFWIFVPVLKMCPFLERLELEAQNLERLVPVLRECLHSSCPLLKFLKISREHPEQEGHAPMHWSLGLLCPGIDQEEGKEESGGVAKARETFMAISPFDKGVVPKTNMDLDGTTTARPSLSLNSHARSCPGFRLKSFHLDRKTDSLFKLVSRQSHRPWHHLLDHHGQTLTDLDISAIVMPLQEFVHLASAQDQMPHLLSLKACVDWTVDEQESLSVAILKKRRGDGSSSCPQSLSGTRQDRTRIVLESVGLRPWTACRGLVKLDLRIEQSRPRRMSESVEERVLLEYLVHEICESSSLEKLTFWTDEIPWSAVMTLPLITKSYPTNAPGTGVDQTDGMKENEEEQEEDKKVKEEKKEEEKKESVPDYGEIGEIRHGGYLDQLSNLYWLKEVTWIQPRGVMMSIEDAEWILDHWPRLYLFSVRKRRHYYPYQCGFDLLKKRRPVLVEMIIENN